MSNSEIISQIIIPRITKNTGIRISPIYEKNIEKYVVYWYNNIKH